MSSPTDTISTDAGPDQPAAKRLGFRLLDAADRWLGRAGERLNPILVKETRQSLKSRQFVGTFGLLLICCWGWSILGLAIMGPAAAFGVHGAQMFSGYFMILAFSLIVIVPFTAFRSLAVEQEDRTYELLSITALGPRQIVAGKLGSAVVQMLIYFSAVSPCLAFTYMLRGLSFPSILFALFCLFLGSLAFSMVGLLVGTLSGEKHWQIILSVLWIVGLLLAFWVSCGMTLFGEVWFLVPFDDAYFWIGLAAMMTGYVTYFILVFYAAVARITFTSDNRSTRLRVIMVVQYACFAGWVTWLMVAEEPHIGGLFFFLTFVSLHWYVMGAIMTGESPRLSFRVRRRLPQSFLGRMFLTWFNPGPGTGYMLAVCGTLAAMLLVFATLFFKQTFGGALGRTWDWDDIQSVLAYGVLEVSYFVIYLGLGLLVIRGLRRFWNVDVVVGVLVHLLLLLIGIGAPLVIQMSLFSNNYSLLQISNFPWTLIEAADSWNNVPSEIPILLVLLPLTAVIIFILNLSGIAREVRYVRIAQPKRVVEEDAALAPQPPPEPTRLSPWDE